MPDFKSRQKSKENQNVEPSQKSSGGSAKSKGRGGESASAGMNSDDMFERHASLLGDHRMSHPANAGRRADIVMQIQRDYGNSYVQRLVDHISSRSFTCNREASAAIPPSFGSKSPPSTGRPKIRFATEHIMTNPPVLRVDSESRCPLPDIQSAILRNPSRSSSSRASSVVNWLLIS